MALIQEAGKGYSDSCREGDLLEEEEESAETASHKQSSKQQYYPFSSSSSSSSSSVSPSPPNLWFGMLHHHHHDHHHSPQSTTPCDSHNSSSSGLGFHHQDAPRKPLHLMDISLGNKEDEVLQVQPNFHGTNSTTTTDDLIEKEHMFDKVVTPSDVGKLNRLVIPKQHAERYFPLDASTNDKGLLLNFEDRNGKLWRFRYSYWNSSQSYVMTKGWSRFVKEKKLDAGDIVSFHRGLGEMYRHRLYIDWRRRPDHAAVPDHHHHHLHHPVANSLITPFLAPNQYSIRWGGGGRMYSVPMATPAPRHPVNYNNYGFQEPQVLLQQQQRQYQQVYGGSYNNNEVNLGSGSLYYLRSTATAPGPREGGGGMAPIIIDSVPVAHGKSSGTSGGSSITRTSDTAGKRLRLFGVNMECSSSYSIANSFPSKNLQCLRESNEEEEEIEEEEEDPVCSSSSGARFGDEKGETSVLFDLNPSFQYQR